MLTLKNWKKKTHHRLNRLLQATPLHFAIISGHYEGAASLLVCRATYLEVNARKVSALDLAKELGVPQLLGRCWGQVSWTSGRQALKESVENLFRKGRIREELGEDENPESLQVFIRRG